MAFPMVKNTAQRIVFPILDADGDPVTGAAGDTPDSEYSLDGGGFGDITDEIHEIATNSGVYYLDLLTGETNGDVVAIQIKTATADTKTTVLVFYTSAQSMDTVDANVDTLLTRLTSTRAGYLDQLDFNLTEAIAALQTQVDTTGVALLASAVDDIWDEVITGAVHNDATSAGRRLRTAGHDTSIARDNTCQAGEDASHVKLDSGASGTNNFYDHMWIYLVSGTGAGQVRLLDSYVGATFVAEVHPDWLTNPDGTTDFTIHAIAPTNTHDIELEGLASINAEVAAALSTYDPPTKGEMDTGHGLLATPAEVASEIADALKTDAMAETTQSIPSATPTIEEALMMLYTMIRNKKTVTENELGVYNDAGTKIHKKALADAAGTYTEDEMISGA